MSQTYSYYLVWTYEDIDKNIIISPLNATSEDITGLHESIYPSIYSHGKSFISPISNDILAHYTVCNNKSGKYQLSHRLIEALGYTEENINQCCSIKYISESDLPSSDYIKFGYYSPDDIIDVQRDMALGVTCFDPIMSYIDPIRYQTLISLPEDSEYLKEQGIDLKSLMFFALPHYNSVQYTSYKIKTALADYKDSVNISALKQHYQTALDISPQDELGVIEVLEF